MQFTGSKLSPTFSPTNIAFKRHESKSGTCIGSVFDEEHVFGVGFGVRLRKSGEKRECSPHTRVVAFSADQPQELKTIVPTLQKLPFVSCSTFEKRLRDEEASGPLFFTPPYSPEECSEPTPRKHLKCSLILNVSHCLFCLCALL